MKEELTAIAARLLNPSSPLNLLSAYKLFIEYDHLFSKDSEPPQNVKELWLFLHGFKLQLQHWKSNVDKLDDYEKKTAELQRYQSELRLITDSLHVEKSKAEKAKEQLSEPYSQLYRVYECIQLQENPLLALSVHTGIRERLLLVTRLEETLTKELNAIKFDDLKLTLNNNRIRIASLQSQLKELKIGLISFAHSTLQKEKPNVQFQLEQHQNYLDKFILYAKLLAQSLSKQEISASILWLSKEMETLKQQLEGLKNELEQVELSHDVKSDLKHLFDNTPDKDNLLFMKKWQETLSTSNLNPIAWFNWWTSETYKADTQNMHQHYVYLSLLLQQSKLQSSLSACKDKLEKTRAMLPDAPHENQREFEAEQLQQIIQCIHTYDSSFSVEEWSHLDLKQKLDQLIIQVSGTVERFSKGVELMDELIQLLSNNTHLRTHNNIIHGNDISLTATEIKQLTEETPKRKQRIQVLVGYISQCKDYIDQTNVVNELESSIGKNQLRVNHLKKCLKKLKSELEKAPNEASLLWDKEQSESGLQLMLQQLPSILAKTHDESVESPVVHEPIPPSQEMEYHQQLDNFHQKILPLVKSMGPEFTHWYQQLFIALQSRVMDEKIYYQATQLLRDIHFELQYPHPLTPHAVLYAYQRLAPQPENNCDSLLKLKPPVPAIDINLLEVNSSPLKTRLNKLYAHQASMQTKYPREAQLLAQATINLHQMANFAEDNDKKEYLQETQDCLADPRYESLENHRGFLKAVEVIAQFFTYLFTLLSSKVDANFRHRFFFVPTCSSQLLQSTHNELISCPA